MSGSSNKGSQPEGQGNQVVGPLLQVYNPKHDALFSERRPCSDDFDREIGEHGMVKITEGLTNLEWWMGKIKAQDGSLITFFFPGYGLVRGKPYELVLDATSRRVWKGSKMTDWTFGNGRHGPKLYGYLTQDGWARQMFSMPGLLDEDTSDSETTCTTSSGSSQESSEHPFDRKRAAEGPAEDLPEAKRQKITQDGSYTHSMPGNQAQPEGNEQEHPAGSKAVEANSSRARDIADVPLQDSFGPVPMET